MSVNESFEAKRIKDNVRKRYAEIAKSLAGGKPSSCCGGGVSEGTGGCCGTGANFQKDSAFCEPGALPELKGISAGLYGDEVTGNVPEEAVLASLGSGNPVALATLAEGDIVLDLGCGGGIDVLLASGKVGASGKVYGLDMTEEMLELARANQKRAGVSNVEFLKGEMEDIPLPDESVDVVISNCVINLSPDKERVFREIYRVLKPGGRIAVSDIVHRGDMPESVKNAVEAWAGCFAGTLDESEFKRMLEDAGFEGAAVNITRVYSLDDVNLVDGKFASAFISARKPSR